MERIKKIMMILAILAIISMMYASNNEHKPGLKDQIMEYIGYLDLHPHATVALLAMLPIFELRGAIPVGIISLEMNVFECYLIAVLANMVPAILILLFFKMISAACRRLDFLNGILEKLFARTKAKAGVIKKYEWLGLIMFVAIPLPITGAWTGALAAYLFGMPIISSVGAIFLGVACAGIIVTLLSIMGIYGAIIAVLALVIVLFFSAKKRVKV